MNKISIVLLHYNNFQLTENCIQNMQQQDWTQIDYHIVVVDNCSPDGSGAELERRYQDTDKVEVLLMPDNLGFSKGNNAGIQFSIEHWNPDFVVVSNNDIEIKDKQFYQKMCEIYRKHGFAIWGPDIYSVGREIHQSPIRSQLLTEAEIRSSIQKMQIKLVLLKLMRPFGIYEVLRKIKKAGGGVSGKEGVHSDTGQRNIVLHGAFFVLSREYFAQFPEGLCHQLFMYMEEDVLAYLSMKRGLEIIYDPTLQVLHYDGMSTRGVRKRRIDKFIFELENIIQSSHTLLKLMEE